MLEVNERVDDADQGLAQGSPPLLQCGPLLRYWVKEDMGEGVNGETPQSDDTELR